MGPVDRAALMTAAHGRIVYRAKANQLSILASNASIVAKTRDFSPAYSETPRAVVWYGLLQSRCMMMYAKKRTLVE